MSCSIARSLAALGDWWSPLILRDVFTGITRFDELQRDLGVARNVLSARLAHLVEAEILHTRPYQENPPRHDYLLTDKGFELVPVLLAVMAWGDRWTAGAAGPPALLRHEACGELTTAVVCCAACGDELHSGEVTPLAGPGGRHGPGTAVIADRLLAMNA